MLQAREQLDLAAKSLGAHGVADVGAEHLDGDRPVVANVAREKNDGHAAVAKFALDDVALTERALNSVTEETHGTTPQTTVATWGVLVGCERRPARPRGVAAVLCASGYLLSCKGPF
jgi:hypothetical protein